MRLAITRKAQKQLDRIPDQVARKIIKEVLQLKENPYPHSSKKLSGQDNYRLRIGTFRVIYFFDKKDKEIVILRVAHRREVYL